MTQDDKDLLIKDISGRLPYGVKYQTRAYNTIRYICIVNQINLDYGGWARGILENKGCEYSEQFEDLKLYLRPMSSMTDEEKKELFEIGCEGNIEYPYGIYFRCQDWLNAHHLDYRGLIPKGLALEAPKGMYKFSGQ